MTYYKDQLLFMFKTNHKPLTRFTYNSGSVVTKSKKILGTGTSKKNSQQDAAEKLLKILNI